MLKLVPLSSPQQKTEYFLQHSSPEDLWIVSHLPAKKHLQDQLLKSSTTIFSNSVQRSSDYWQWLFSVNCPEWRSVSDSLMFALIEEWFNEAKVDSRYQDIGMFYNFFSQCLPIFSQGQEALFEDWMRGKAERAARLHGWFTQAKSFWRVLHDKKWIGRPWVLGVLLNRENIHFGDFKNIYIDLGADIKHEEVELLLRMSQQMNVTVFVPRASWATEYAHNLSVYGKLLAAGHEDELLEDDKTPASLTLAEAPSVLRESKAAVAAVREWLRNGVEPNQIALVSSNIEDYWDILREHLVIEGVPVNKAYVARAISMPFVQVWLARLRLQVADFEQADLETSLFNAYQVQHGDYETFRRNFSVMYDPAVARQRFLKSSGSPHADVLNFREFVDFISARWAADDKSLLEDVIDEMAKDLRPQDAFSYALWLKYLELVVTDYDKIPLVAQQENGVILANLNQADWSDFSHMVVLGCEQSRLREIRKSPLSMEDVWAVEADIGFFLERNESNKKEFALRWLLERPALEARLTRSQTDFDGAPQTAASFWLRLEAQLGKENRQWETRWDGLMKSGLTAIARDLSWREGEMNTHAVKFKLENDLTDYADIGMIKSVSVSPSSLKSLFECGFKFYAGKILGLEESHIFDLEIDHSVQGQLLHKMAEEIVRNYADLNITKDQLSELYDRVSSEVSESAPHQDFWRGEKQRHLNWIANFIEHEKEWRREHPGAKPIANEANIKGYIGEEDGQLVFSKEQKPGFYAFSGRIDRVDRDSAGNLAVIDYKTTFNGLVASKSWANKGQFQMPLYASALEQGFANEVPAAPVRRTSYFAFKTGESGKGYIENDSEHGFRLSAKSSQDLPAPKKEEVFSEVFMKVMELLKNIEKGYFPAIPVKDDICITCNWRALCRNPRLK